MGVGLFPFFQRVFGRSPHVDIRPKSFLAPLLVPYMASQAWEALHTKPSKPCLSASECPTLQPKPYATLPKAHMNPENGTLKDIYQHLQKGLQ